MLTALRDILNDPAIMPNEDCEDLIVNVFHVEFGRTFQDIYLDFYGCLKRRPEPGEEKRHDRYMRQAHGRGEDTYDDLSDVAYLPEVRRIVELALQKRLGLAHTPRLHFKRYLGRGEGGAWKGA